MEDFFKFIPIVLWVLYKILGGSKAKQQKSKKTVKGQQKKRATPSIEDILRELAGETKEEAKPVKQSYDETQESRRTKIEVTDHQYDFRPEYEHHADTGPSVEEVLSEVDEMRNEKANEIGKSIDLRQAVIYDAILNRPKY